MIDPEAVFVLVPDKLGVTVASLGQLLARVDDTETLGELADNAGIDSAGWSDGEVAEMARRALNLNLNRQGGTR